MTPTESKRLWRAANPEKAKAQTRAAQKRWREAHPEKAKAQSWRTPAKHREQRLKSEYNLTPADCDAMLVKQGGRCAICRTDKPGGRGTHFSVDHDHVTGKVRGLLCANCNTGIGKLKDDAWLLMEAATYLWNRS